jgi:hypothetical protein
VRSRGAESYIRLAKEIIAHYFAQAESAPAEVAEVHPESAALTAVQSDAAGIETQVTGDRPQASVAAAAEQVAAVDAPASVENQESPAEEGAEEASVDDMGKIA